MKIAVIITFLLVLAGCAQEKSLYLKNEMDYGAAGGLFRDRWWNYYERGFSFAEGGYHQEAIQDLQTAVKKREDDQWRSRTYGMHFIDYFPHRELGIIYYHVGKYHEAVAELEESLRTAESAKAKYFLNRARKAVLEETEEDRLPPDLKIDSPSEGFITNQFSIALKGEVQDDHFVSYLAVNDIPLPLELSAKRVPLEKELNLKRGTNEIKVQAADLTGKTIEKVLRVEVDREGPLIIIENHQLSGKKIILTGLLSDNTGITSFSINGQDILGNVIPAETGIQNAGRGLDSHLRENDGYLGVFSREIEFQQEITLPEDTHTIVIKAQDMAENVTTGELHLTSISPDSMQPAPDSILKNLPLFASLLPFTDGADDVAPTPYAFLESVTGKITDNTPPVISIKNLADVQTVYDDVIFLEGKVSDEDEIQSLTINGESILKRKGKDIFFNHFTRLNEGENKFHIEAVDTYRNRSQKLMLVNRKIPKIRQIGSRMRITILPFGHKGERSLSGDAIYDGLISAFVDQRRFNLVEREKLGEILQELRLSQTELADPDNASKVGKIAVADAILTGTIYEGKNSIEILTRLVDTETSAIVETKDVFDQDKGMPNVMSLMQGLALKYKQSFPLLEGMVIKKERKGILTDLGNENRVKKDMGIIIFREGEELRHPVTGRVLGSEPVELGEAKIENVYEAFSSAIIKKGKSERVNVKDKVITK